MARMPGLTTKELMARIGHASPVAALGYQHATQGRDRQVADFIEAQMLHQDPETDDTTIAPTRQIHTARRAPRADRLR